jgi:hypothetical protein
LRHKFRRAADRSPCVPTRWRDPLWLDGAWSQRDNVVSVLTDCPQRDERLGWMGADAKNS